MTLATNKADDRINPYEASTVKPDDKLGRPSFRLSATYIVALILSGGLFLAVLFTRSRFESIFIDFDAELPHATIIALNPWTLVVTGTLFLFTLAKEFIEALKKRMRLCNGIACLAAIIIGFAYAVAIFLPLIRLISALS